MENTNALKQFLEEWGNDARVKIDTRIIIPRSGQDRRGSGDRPPPYLTEEGMVMFDRREGRDRRSEM